MDLTCLRFPKATGVYMLISTKFAAKLLAHGPMRLNEPIQ